MVVPWPCPSVPTLAATAAPQPMAPPRTDPGPSNLAWEQCTPPSATPNPQGMLPSAWLCPLARTDLFHPDT